jgi:hypothetical protein
MASPTDPQHGDQATLDSFTDSDWNLVRIELPAICALPLETATTELPVSVVNKAGKALPCGTEKPLTLHWQLYDYDGRKIQHARRLTPLSAAIPPGSRREQALKIEIPTDINERVASIQVRLGTADGSWVSKLHRGHARPVLLDRGKCFSRLQEVMLQGARIWPLGRSNGLRWPSSAMMVSEQHKLLYIPVAKCACTSLKSSMLALAEIEQYPRAVELGVHLVTDRFNTGVQLKDKSMKRAWDILASTDYFKFMVVREPFERLVSAYLEKFVYNRHNERNLLHTRDVIARAQGSSAIDLQRGISFDDFVSAIITEEPGELDPHWRPQNLYRKTVKRRINTYKLEHIDRLEDALAGITGQALQFGHRNKTRRSDRLLRSLSTLPAAEIEKLGSFDPRSFESTDRREAIQDYYRDDIELYHAAE